MGNLIKNTKMIIPNNVKKIAIEEIEHDLKEMEAFQKKSMISQAGNHNFWAEYCGTVEAYVSGGQFVEINVKPGWTFNDQKLKIMEEFNFEEDGLNTDDVRLRNYKQENDLIKEPLEGVDEMTLKDMKFFGKRAVWVETKKPGNEWKKYDPAEIKVRIAFWNDDYIGIETIDSEKIKFDQFDTTKETSVQPPQNFLF